MKLKSLLSLAVAVLLSVSVSAFAQGVGKIHGKVIDPTGIAKTDGSGTFMEPRQPGPMGPMEA